MTQTKITRNQLSHSTSASFLVTGMEWFPTNPGGLNRYVYELIHALNANRDRVEFCGLDLPSKGQNLHLYLTNLAESKQTLANRLWSMRQQFSQRTFANPDAINLHFALYSLPLLQALPQNSPLTFTFHGPWAMESAANSSAQSKAKLMLQQWVEQRVFDRCDRFIVLSQAFGDILHKTYNIPWEKINIIPGGVNTSFFEPTLTQQEARSSLNWPVDRPIVFTPRRLVNRMGLKQLITSLVEVKRKIPDIWLAIAGKGPERNALERLANDLDLNNHVHFLGFLPDEQLPAAYQSANLTVMPSQSLEGFGLVLLESMASGTPALCTPVGGMPDVLSPFCPELIISGTDSEAIGQHIIDLLKGNIALPTRAACRDYVMKNFDWQTVAIRVREVLLA